MKTVFKKIKAKCAVCGTPLNGSDLLKRGGYYYCPSDYERTSPQERSANRAMARNSNYIKRVLSDD